MNSSTFGKMKVDESGNKKFTGDKWAAKLVSENKGPTGFDAVIDIKPPATVAIGEWSLKVDTKTKLDGKTKIYRYEHPDDFYMLFNPWCQGIENMCGYHVAFLMNIQNNRADQHAKQLLVEILFLAFEFTGRT